MKKITTVCFLTILLVTALSLHSVSALMKSLSMAELGSMAPVVCRGEVKAVHSEWNDEGTFIWTYVTLNVLETVKGEVLKGEEIILKVPDGQVGDIVQRSSEQISFQEGEEAVLFLKDPLSEKGSHFKVVGRWQGKFRVKDKKVKGKDLASFIDQVKMEIATED